MTNILPALDESRAYVECPMCARAGTEGVPLKRDSHLFKCPFMHQFTWMELQRFQPRMTKMEEIMVEQPNPNAVKWAVYVMPQTKSALEHKYSGRLISTIATFLDMLAEEGIIFIQHSEAAELKKRGLHNGQQIISALDSVRQLQQERDEALQQLDKFRRMLQQADQPDR